MTTIESRPSVVDTKEAKLAMSGARLAWIAADHFTVDPTYDRPANEDRIIHMAENWKDEAFGVVFASERPGEDKLYLLDGQHRVGALRRQGRKTHLCPTLIFEGLSVADEADLFVLMNKNRRPLSPSELFKAAIASGDKGAIAIQAVFDDLNLKLDSHAKDPYTVNCVSTIWRIYRAMGTPGIDAALSLVLVTWGDPPPQKAFHQHLLLTVARILFYGENKVDVDRLRKTLGSESPDAWLGRAEAIRAMSGGDRTNVLMDSILREYNKGRPLSQQLQPDSMKPKKDPFTAATRYRRGGKKDGK